MLGKSRSDLKAAERLYVTERPANALTAFFVLEIVGDSGESHVLHVCLYAPFDGFLASERHILSTH